VRRLSIIRIVSRSPDRINNALFIILLTVGFGTAPFGRLSCEVGVELFQDLGVKVEVELAVTHLPGADEHREQSAEGDAVGAVTTILWYV